ncbi:MAG TPA: hypothetical protein VIY47_10245 [Ignavibacteriaceae bacterium]
MTNTVTPAVQRFLDEMSKIMDRPFTMEDLDALTQEAADSLPPRQKEDFQHLMLAALTTPEVWFSEEFSRE